MSRIFYIIVMCLLLIGCSQSYEETSCYNIKDYQGFWRDTIFNGKGVFVEDLIINDNSIKYTLSDVNTHVVLDTLNGNFLIGSENKIGWNCFSPITNNSRQLYWTVLGLSTYQMRLYSNLQGEHNFRRVYRPTIEEYEIQDTLMELLQYKQYLPLHKDELAEIFGYYNRFSNDNEMAYYTHHPLFSQLSLKKNNDNDSVYSYALSVKEWSKCYPVVSSYYTKLRNAGRTTEYIDGESLETSDNIVVTDLDLKQIRFVPIKDYDYWPNVSCYIGKNLQTFMNDYKDKYVYKYYENTDLELCCYSFQTHIDSICSEIFVGVDSDGMIRQSGVSFFQNNRKNKAQQELETMAAFLKRKYYYDRSGVDENGNKIYYYYSHENINKSHYEIRLRINQQVKNTITKVYQIAINFIQLNF